MKRLFAFVMSLIFIVSVAGVTFAGDGAAVEGTVKKIDGKKITVKDTKGKEITVEVKDTAGAKIGDTVEIKGGKVTVKKPAVKKPEAGGAPGY